MQTATQSDDGKDLPSLTYRWGLAIQDGAVNVCRIFWYRTRKAAMTAAVHRCGSRRGAVIAKYLPDGYWR